MRRANVLPMMLALTVLGQLTDGARAQEGGKAQPVYVINQPEKLRVEGVVSLAGPIEGVVAVREPIPQGRLVAFREVEVPPVAKGEVTRLVQAGTLQAEGFVNMVVSLAGFQRSTPTRAGEVGVLLIPLEELPTRAWEEQGQALFAVEASVESKPAGPAYFATSPLRAMVAFPRYRVLLYNNTDRSVAVTVYLYLTS